MLLQIIQVHNIGGAAGHVKATLTHKGSVANGDGYHYQKYCYEMRVVHLKSLLNHISITVEYLNRC
jgi:hypothetical protein